MNIFVCFIAMFILRIGNYTSVCESVNHVFGKLSYTQSEIHIQGVNYVLLSIYLLKLQKN